MLNLEKVNLVLCGLEFSTPCLTSVIATTDVNGKFPRSWSIDQDNRVVRACAKHSWFSSSCFSSPCGQTVPPNLSHTGDSDAWWQTGRCWLICMNYLRLDPIFIDIFSWVAHGNTLRGVLLVGGVTSEQESSQRKSKGSMLHCEKLVPKTVDPLTGDLSTI